MRPPGRGTYSQEGPGLCGDTRTGCGGAGRDPSRGRCRRSPASDTCSPSCPLGKSLERTERREMSPQAGRHSACEARGTDVPPRSFTLLPSVVVMVRLGFTLFTSRKCIFFFFSVFTSLGHEVPYDVVPLSSPQHWYLLSFCFVLFYRCGDEVASM